MHEESESMTEESDIAEGCTTTICSDKIQSKAVRNAADDRGTEAQQGCLPACSIEQHVHAHVLPYVLVVRNLLQTDAVQQWPVTP